MGAETSGLSFPCGNQRAKIPGEREVGADHEDCPDHKINQKLCGLGIWPGIGELGSARTPGLPTAHFSRV